MASIKIEQHSFAGTLWFAAWLFTIGFLHLGLWKSVLAIVLWAYFLGVHFSALAPWMGAKPWPRGRRSRL